MAQYLDALKALGATAYWSFSEETGTEAADSIGAYPGVYTGTPEQGFPWLMPGEADGSFDTNGGTGRVVIPDPSAELALGAEFALGVWVRFHSLPPTDWGTIFRKEANGPYVLVTPYGQLQLAWFDVAPKSLTSPGDLIRPGQRVFLGVEVDAGDGVARLYIDGEMVAETPMENEGAWNDFDIGWGAQPDAGAYPIDATMDGAFLKLNGTLGDDGWTTAYEAGKFPPVEPVEWKGLRHLRIAIGNESQISPTVDASRYDAVIVQSFDTNDRDVLHAEGKGTRVFAYQNLSFIADDSTIALSSCGVAEEGADPSWYALDQEGQPARSESYPWLSFGDLANEDYLNAWADQVIARCAGFDGVFIDDVNWTYEYHIPTGSLANYPTQVEYADATGLALEFIGERLRMAGFQIAANFGSWTGNRPVVDSWLPLVDAALDEQATRYAGNGEYAYEGSPDSAIESGILAARFGTEYWSVTPFIEGDRNGAAYGAAIALLTSEGLAALASNPWPVDYALTSWDESVFQLADSFGPPQGEASKVDGIWRRKFRTGTVYVNTGAETRETNLQGGQRLSLEAHRAAFIVAPETSFGAELYESLKPLAYADQENDYALLTLCDAIGTMAEELELLTRADDEGRDPWSIIMDADRAPGYMLPYIGQFVGQTIPVGTPEDEARELIRSPSNQERGTVSKMVHDLKATLTGRKYVRVIERDGSPWIISFYVRTSECPDPTASLAALEAVKAAGFILNLVVSEGVVIDELTGSIDDLPGTIDNLSS